MDEMVSASRRGEGLNEKQLKNRCEGGRLSIFACVIPAFETRSLVLQRSAEQSLQQPEISANVIL